MSYGTKLEKYSCLPYGRNMEDPTILVLLKGWVSDHLHHSYQGCFLKCRFLGPKAKRIQEAWESVFYTEPR